MKICYILALIFCLAHSVYGEESKPIIVNSVEEISQYAKEHKVRCDSTIWGACTAMYCGAGYYNEEGIFVFPEPCNICTYHYECSNGVTLILKVDSY